LGTGEPISILDSLVEHAWSTPPPFQARPSACANAAGSTALLLYADNHERTFLGCLNCSEPDSDSVWNELDVFPQTKFQLREEKPVVKEAAAE
jgi:hypothetical protein